MHHWMDLVGVGKLQSIGHGTHTSKNLVRTKVTQGKLLAGMRSNRLLYKRLEFEIYLVSYLELSFRALFVSLVLHPSLSMK